MPRTDYDTSLEPVAIAHAPWPPEKVWKALYGSWWSEQTRKGDPMRRPHLVTDAFAAGFYAGYRHRELEK